MNNYEFLALFISFFVAVLSGPKFIEILRKLKFGQTVRDDGPESHLKKNGTPTMGGIIFLLGIFVGSVFFIKTNKNIIPVLLMTLGYGIIGFIDDYIKVVLKRSLGLKVWQKLVLQFIVTGVFAYYLVNVSGVSLLIRVPFMNGYMLDIGYFSIPLLFIAVLGTVNGANLTDGVDGLASSVTCAIAAFFLLASNNLSAGLEPVILATIGGLLGFLVFNVHPAKVFMGDTGSLALGGFVIGTAYMMNMPVFVVIVAVIYVIESLSVMIQVGYFKISGGKRIFKMAPIHHHYEKSGWSETKVVYVFTLITILASVIGYIAF